MQFVTEAKKSVVSINTKPQELQVNKTWWFEKPDKSVFAAGKKEAWEMYVAIRKGLSKNKLVGVSDGTIYAQAMIDAQKAFLTSRSKKLALDKAQAILREGHQKEYEAGLGKIEVPPQNYKFGPGASEIKGEI